MWFTLTRTPPLPFIFVSATADWGYIDLWPNTSELQEYTTGEICNSFLGIIGWQLSIIWVVVGDCSTADRLTNDTNYEELS